MAKFVEFQNLAEDQAQPVALNLDSLVSIQPHDVAGEISDKETKIVTTGGTYLVAGNYKDILDRVNKA